MSLERAFADNQVFGALQSQLSHREMDPPHGKEPTRARATADPYELDLVEEMRFQCPDYLKVLVAILLILLISVSDAIALLRRDVDNLLFGSGGLILSVGAFARCWSASPCPAWQRSTLPFRS